MFYSNSGWYPWGNFLDNPRTKFTLNHSADIMFQDFMKGLGLIKSEPSIKELQSSYLIEIEVPRFQASEIEVCLDRGILIARGNRKDDRFEYAWYVPVDANGEITSELEKGVLSIKIPKSIKKTIRIQEKTS